MIRPAVLALITYALGLVPFYFLTPVQQSVPLLFARPTAVRREGIAVAPAPTPTPSRSEATPKVGAEVISVAAPSPASSATPVVATVPTSVPADPRYAFLLMGYGGAGHDGAYLTDSLMVVIVDPEGRSLVLLSLPRDSWVPLLFDGRTAVYNKINTAYAFAQDPTLYPERLARYTGRQGPGTFAADTVSRILGIPVSYYLGLDFAGFRQMIDTIGGIDVDVPASFTARYPANDDPSIDPSWTVVRFTKGMQHLNGERAIQFARARETLDNVDEGSDFARSRRQRLIMEAFKRRLFEPGGLIHLPQLIGIAASHVDTNYAIPDVARLTQLVLSWQDVKIYQAALTEQNYLAEATGPDGAFVLVPSSPSHTWGQVRAFARHLWQDPARAVAMAQTRVVVENDTGVAGSATRLSEVLADLGYVVGSPTTGSRHEQTRLVDRTNHQAGAPLAQLLAKDLGMADLAVTTDLPGEEDEVVLQLGVDGLAILENLPRDDQVAPSGVVGIERIGVWTPDTGETAVSATETPRHPPTVRRTATITGTVSLPATGTPEASLGSGLASPRAGTGTPIPSPGRGPSATPRASATPTPRPSPTPSPRAPTPTPPAGVTMGSGKGRSAER